MILASFSQSLVLAGAEKQVQPLSEIKNFTNSYVYFNFASGVREFFKNKLPRINNICLLKTVMIQISHIALRQATIMK